MTDAGAVGFFLPFPLWSPGWPLPWQCFSLQPRMSDEQLLLVTFVQPTLRRLCRQMNTELPPPGSWADSWGFTRHPTTNHSLFKLAKGGCEGRSGMSKKAAKLNLPCLMPHRFAWLKSESHFLTCDSCRKEGSSPDQSLPLQLCLGWAGLVPATSWRIPKGTSFRSCSHLERIFSSPMAVFP